MALIALVRLLLVVGGLLIVGLVRWVGRILGGTNNIHMSSISDPICCNMLILVPISRLVIGMGLIWGGLLINPYHTILNEPLLKEHSFLFDIFIGLQAIHGHVVSQAGMGIVDEHFHHMTLGQGAGYAGSEGLPSLQVFGKAFSTFLLSVDKINYR